MKEKKQTKRETNVGVMRMGLALAGVQVTKRTAELIIEVYEAGLQKGGQFSLRDAAQIEDRINNKYDKQEVEAQRNINGILTDMRDVVTRLEKMEGKPDGK